MSNAPLPLGISDFAKLRGLGALYVDKTAQIAEMLACGGYLFLARPRRFGKSLLCSTLRALYEGRRELFAGLAIEPRWDWQRRHPVLHLTLALDCTSAEELRQALVRQVQAAARAAALDLAGSCLPGESLLELIRALQRRSGRRVVVLIDEYDKPVHDHLEQPALARALRDVLAGFYGALKACDGELELLFLTGVGRLVRSSVFSALNQVRDLTLHPATATLLGYTEDELQRAFAPWLEQLARQHRLSLEQALERLRARYDGYRWGGAQRVYNPWSVLSCLAEGGFGSWWWSTGTPRWLVELAQRLGAVEDLSAGVWASDLALHLDIDELKLVPLLWNTGYLTVQEQREQLYRLGFPNAEVREAWHGMLLDRLAPGLLEGGSTVAQRLHLALIAGDEDEFRRALAALFAALPASLQVPREAYYHSVFLAALQAIGARVLAEPGSWRGRADAVVETPRAVYIIEMKLGSAEDALQQIRERGYHQPYAADPRALVLVGIGGLADRQVDCRWLQLRPPRG
ncbi:MAG: AAA family ATPase [Planctomycetota bacterium]|nr:AAA family ATPase [Planctomycetota bacterium]